MKMQETIKFKLIAISSIFLILEISLIFFLSIFFSQSISGASGGNLTVQTNLTVTNPGPEVATIVVSNVSNVFSGSSQNITLSPGTSKTVYCNGIVRDWNNGTAIVNITAVLYQNGTSYSAADDNNTHYSNTTCTIDYNVYNPFFGDDELGNYTVNYSCSFDVQYYANPGYWNCSSFATNIFNLNDTNSTLTYTNQLLALTLPDTIEYGEVNSTFVSNEQTVNVSNAGNIATNISVKGYAVTINDSLAMNCTKGNLKNISVMYEKYNLTMSNPIITGLTDFENHYINLTNVSVTRRFSLPQRTDDTIDDSINATYWRIYVPRGVAGTCSGNILFGATTGAGI